MPVDFYDPGIPVYNRNTRPYTPLYDYQLTPRNIINWSRKLLFYKKKADKILDAMTKLINNKRYDMEHKRSRILMHHTDAQYYTRIVSHYTRLLAGVPSNPRDHIQKQAALIGQLNQDIARYARSDHRIHNMLRTGNLTEGLDEVPWNMREEYRQNRIKDRMTGRQWRDEKFAGKKKRKRDEF